MLDRAILHLTVIAESVAILREYTTGVNREAFLSDRILRDAVTMRLQWTQIVAFRHRVAHDYRTVDFRILWDIVTTELDALDSAVRRMLAARGEPPP